MRLRLTLAVAVFLSIIGPVLTHNPAAATDNLNDPRYWETQFEHPTVCYKHTGDSSHGYITADGLSVILHPFNPQWPGDHWEGLVVKGATDRTVIQHPQAGVRYFAPPLDNGNTPEVSHWIVCKGTTPPDTTTTSTTSTTTTSTLPPTTTSTTEPPPTTTTTPTTTPPTTTTTVTTVPPSTTTTSTTTPTTTTTTTTVPPSTTTTTSTTSTLPPSTTVPPTTSTTTSTTEPPPTTQPPVTSYLWSFDGSCTDGLQLVVFNNGETVVKARATMTRPYDPAIPIWLNGIEIEAGNTARWKYSGQRVGAVGKDVDLTKPGLFFVGDYTLTLFVNQDEHTKTLTLTGDDPNCKQPPVTIPPTSTTSTTTTTTTPETTIPEVTDPPPDTLPVTGGGRIVGTTFELTDLRPIGITLMLVGIVMLIVVQRMRVRGK